MSRYLFVFLKTTIANFVIYIWIFGAIVVVVGGGAVNSGPSSSKTHGNDYTKSKPARRKTILSLYKSEPGAKKLKTYISHLNTCSMFYLPPVPLAGGFMFGLTK